PARISHFIVWPEACLRRGASTGTPSGQARGAPLLSHNRKATPMGKKSLLSATALLLLVLSVGCDSSTAPDDDARFTAELTCCGEARQVETDAAGVASFELDDDVDGLDYTPQVTDIDSGTMAHIHIGPIDDTGPVVAFLFGPVAGGTMVTGTQV